MSQSLTFDQGHDLIQGCSRDDLAQGEMGVYIMYLQLCIYSSLYGSVQGMTVKSAGVYNTLISTSDLTSHLMAATTIIQFTPLFHRAKKAVLLAFTLSAN